MVQRLQIIMIPGLQKGPKGLLAQGAVAAIPFKLVGDMPGDDRGVPAISLCKKGIDRTHLFPVDRGGEAMVLPPSVQVAGCPGTSFSTWPLAGSTVFSWTVAPHRAQTVKSL